MIGSLWTGVSGLASHTKAIENESNNIANTNTVGYKASRVSFSDQIYQNQIGKGSSIQGVEKLFTQGSMKLTGAEYDVALQGDGFFTVLSKNNLGSAETYYTRAGNFRMGESGTLQTVDGYELQGWAMSSIDPTNDVVSTNKNVTRFTKDFTNTIGSAIIKHKDFLETIASKTTNLNDTVKSDSTTVFSGAGEKTKASKLKDVELAKAEYNARLAAYKADPDAKSSGSSYQISQANYKTGVAPTSIIGKEGDSIKMIIDGVSYTQSFVVTKTSETYRQQIWDGLTTDEKTLYGLVDPETISSLSAAAKAEEVAKYDKIAGKIETYKAMADRISNSSAGGLVAYLAVNTLDSKADVLDPNGSYEASTKLGDMLQGVIQIKSLIPGKSFKITEVSEATTGTDSTVKGDFQTTSTAVQGTGKQALEDARDALSRLVSGNEQKVYTTSDLYGDGTQGSRTFNFSIEIYDKDTGKVIPVPNDGNTPPTAVSLNLGTFLTGDIDSIVDAINNGTTSIGPQLGDYIVAKNVNGYLVLETNDSNYDVTFDTKFNISPSVSLNTLIDNASYSYTIDAGNGRTLTIPFTVGNSVSGDMDAIYAQFMAAIDSFNLDPANVGYELKYGSNVNGTFSIESVNGKTISGTLSLTSDPNIIDAPTGSSSGGTKTVLDSGTFTIPPATTLAWNTEYTMTIQGQTIKYKTPTGTTGAPTLDSIVSGLIAAARNNATVTSKVTLSAGTTGTGVINLTQIALSTPYDPPKGLTVTGSVGSYASSGNFVAGTAPSTSFTFSGLTAANSKTDLTFVIGGVRLTFTTDEDPTTDKIFAALQELFDKNTTLAAKYSISQSGDVITVTQKPTSAGYTTSMASTPTVESAIPTLQNWPLNKTAIEANTDYSGRKGAGGEFMEITTRVDQTSTQSNLQLRLDLLNISDSKFGKFSVDANGVITITEDGIEYAVGQLSIARFTNNRGLSAVGNNNFKATQDSGDAIYSTNNANTAGMKGNTLELSQADLSESLVNLMVFQRAFEANAKSITTSDEMLTTLINLKR